MYEASLIDRTAAMEQAIQYSYNSGRKRIGVIKPYKNEPMHPYHLGMISGYKSCGIEFDESLYHEIDINENAFPGNQQFPLIIMTLANNRISFLLKCYFLFLIMRKRMAC